MLNSTLNSLRMWQSIVNISQNNTLIWKEMQSKLARMAYNLHLISRFVYSFFDIKYTLLFYSWIYYFCLLQYFSISTPVLYLYYLRLNDENVSLQLRICSESLEICLLFKSTYILNGFIIWSWKTGECMFFCYLTVKLKWHFVSFHLTICGYVFDKDTS